MKKLICILTLLLALVCVFAACDAARSITKSEIVNGELVITYSDGTTENLGKVVGADGEKGDKGDTGAQGEKGDKGDTGATGAQGIQGEKGDKGDTGAQGEKGEDLTDDNPQGLDFYPLPDGTYGVKAGKALYLEEVTIPATYKGKAVTQILPNAFSEPDTENKSLKKLVLPSSVTTICERAIMSCAALETIVIPSSVTRIGERAFQGSNAIKEVCITDIASWCKISFASEYSNPLYYAEKLYVNNDSVTALIIPEGVTSISGYVFSGCAFLESITFPSTLTSISEHAFYQCNGPKSVTIPSSMASIDSGAFEYFNSLTSIDIPGSVTSIGDSAFCNCTALTSVTIPNSVTSIGVGVFFGCDSLTSVIFEENSRLEVIERSAFSQCYELISISVPKSVKSIGDYAFSGDDDGGYMALESITFEEGSQLTYIGYGAFAYCTSLSSFVIPNSVSYIGSDAFSACWELSYTIYNNGKYLGSSENPYLYFARVADADPFSNADVTIANTTKFIGSDAFLGYSRYTSLTIPASVICISSYAFHNSCFTQIVFENKNGWVVIDDFYLIDPDFRQEISATDLADPATAAEYLTSDYYYYYWHRS